MKWNREWQPRASVITFGRAAGIVIILLGVALSAWNVLDTDSFVIRGEAQFKIRFFLQSSLSYLASGGLLIVAAEIADRLGWESGSQEDEVAEEQEPGPEA